MAAFHGISMTPVTRQITMIIKPTMFFRIVPHEAAIDKLGGDVNASLPGSTKNREGLTSNAAKARNPVIRFIILP